MQWLRRIVVFALAVVATTALAALLSTHFVLQALAALDIEIGFADRMHAYAHDIASMAPLYGIVVAAALLVAFPVAALAIRLVPSLRTPGYVLAGAAAIIVALVVMETVLAIMPVAGARTLPGLAAQGLAGAAGGLLFARLSRPRAAQRPATWA